MCQFSMGNVLSRGKHVFSLFFSDLSRLGAIKVQICLICYCVKQDSHFSTATFFESMQAL